MDHATGPAPGSGWTAAAYWCSTLFGPSGVREVIEGWSEVRTGVAGCHAVVRGQGTLTPRRTGRRADRRRTPRGPAGAP